MERFTKTPAKEDKSLEESQRCARSVIDRGLTQDYLDLLQLVKQYPDMPAYITSLDTPDDDTLVKSVVARLAQPVFEDNLEDIDYHRLRLDLQQLALKIR